MYPSGLWHGFWEQEFYGRQPMIGFHLTFTGDTVAGEGTDVIGPFVIFGEVERSTGAVRFTKQYLGRHSVLYDGRPDGEGTIGGTWTIGRQSGLFMIRPVLPPPSPDAPIHDVGK